MYNKNTSGQKICLRTNRFSELTRKRTRAKRQQQAFHIDETTMTSRDQVIGGETTYEEWKTTRMKKRNKKYKKDPYNEGELQPNKDIVVTLPNKDPTMRLSKIKTISWSMNYSKGY